MLFGSVLQGKSFAVLAHLAQMRAAAGQRTRFMALGDYANSRGAADMGLLPDRLPGYASIEDAAARERLRPALGRLAQRHARPGRSGSMLDAAKSAS